ncbi:Hypothetical protein SCLAV_p0113 (plasmid) [Streptomyces clavuligerus]|uniref:Uncharacterized protein n=1 Tax=Streptomyces clavuligerus TaxID=1901 RepID=D5SI61_STRCL|nr:Hypothetical protein SCLAV_p0113 [Streptomyces clavuligerus]
MPRCPGAQVPRCPGAQVPRCPGAQVCGRAVPHRGVDVDEVADRAAVRECADRGADHVVQGENGTVLGDRRWRPEGFLEDVDLARLAGGAVGGDEPARQRTGLDVPDIPAALGQTVTDRADDLVDGSRVLGGDVQVLREPVDQTMGLYGVSAGDHERIGRADGEDVGQEPAVPFCEVHAAAVAVAVVSWGKRLPTRPGSDG